MEPSLEDLKRISSEVDRDEVINNGAGVLEVVSQASNGNGLNTPYLKLLRQEHVTTEYYSRNTIHKLVHVVVKNLNFPIEIISNVDLTKCNGLEAKLFYDFDKLEDKEKKEVNYVKNPPLDYRVSLLEGGMKALIEARIKVLTSQHEDSLFKIRFSALEPSTGTELEVYSEPIKVISKLTQLKKPRGSSASGSSLNSSSSGIPPIPISSPDFPPSPTSILSLAEGKPLPITPPSSSSSRKRQSQSQSQSNAQNVNSAQMNASLSLAAMANSASFMSVTSDTFAALERLEKQQEESFKVLKEIRGKIFGEESNTITTEDISTGNNSESLGDNSYEQAFKSFISSISSANQSELQQRTELVLSSLNSTELDHLAAFVDILNSSSYFSQQPLLKKRQRSS